MKCSKYSKGINKSGWKVKVQENWEAIGPEY